MDAHDVDGVAVMLDRGAAVAKCGDPQCFPHVEPFATVVRVELVVSADSEDSVRRLKIGERSKIGSNFCDGAVHEIAADRDQIDILRVHDLDHLAGEVDPAGRSHVQVGDQGDPVSVEALR